MSNPLPKAALYYYKQSIWASAPLLALEEKGYGSDEVDLKEVDLSKGENFEPSYLRINPNATVPTLVVPLKNTLQAEIESRYKAIQDTKSIIEFLDKSRSPQSRTHTTSSAPAPSLAPATMAFTTVSDRIIALLHSQPADPNALKYFNAHDDESLRALARELLPTLAAKRDTLTRLIDTDAQAEVHVSEKTQMFWTGKLAAVNGIVDVLGDAEKEAGELGEEGRKHREEYFAAATEARAALRDVLLELHKELIGPYALGDQVSIADLHLAAWVTRLASLSGASPSEDGGTVTSKLEAHVGGSFSLPKDLSVEEARRRAGLPALPDVKPSDRENRLAAFWDAFKERASWKKVYAEGLH